MVLMGLQLRIKKNDRPFNVYSCTETPGADSYPIYTYPIRYSNMPADMQPIGSKVNLAEYGVNATPANLKKMFIDSTYNPLINDVIVDLSDNEQYRIVGKKKWYSHIMLLLEWMEAKVAV